jgi:hypothetical protein
VQLQYYLGIKNPNELTDEDWANNVQALAQIRQQELKHQATLAAKTVAQLFKK